MSFRQLLSGSAEPPAALLSQRWDTVEVMESHEPGSAYPKDAQLPPSAVEALNRRSLVELEELAAMANEPGPHDRATDVDSVGDTTNVDSPTEDRYVRIIPEQLVPDGVTHRIAPEELEKRRLRALGE